MTDTPEPIPPVPPTSPASQPKPPWLPIAIAVAVIAVVSAGILVWRTQGGAGEQAVNVQPYTPPTELITARDRVLGYAAPDATSETLVMFGQGVTLNVTGRVSSGLGNDWYAVAWNERTAFVRQQDAVAGTGAPPTPDAREEEPEEVVKAPDPFEDSDEEEEVDAPPVVVSSGSLEISDVNWIREPNTRDFARFYPEGALEDERSGRVVLDCVVAGNGGLGCSVAQESPSGHGFGQAAVNISRQVRIQPTLPDGSPAAGRHLRLPLTFRAG